MMMVEQPSLAPAANGRQQPQVAPPQPKVDAKLNPPKPFLKLDNVLPPPLQTQITDLLHSPGWDFGWKSHKQVDIFSFWHKHFAGHRNADPVGARNYDCSKELAANAPVIHGFWRYLAERGVFGKHVLVRCYANAHAYGGEGTLHTDSANPAAFTAIYYANDRWSPNWGGETMLFNREETDVIAVIYPRPNRLFIFPGIVPHVARGLSRSCPLLRTTLMFKFERPGWSPPLTKTG